MSADLALSLVGKSTELHYYSNDFENLSYLLNKYEDTDPRLLE